MQENDNIVMMNIPGVLSNDFRKSSGTGNSSMIAPL
jgi:hypothetical protein